jgi:hypothetical protein
LIVDFASLLFRLGFVLDHFVDAFDGKIDTNWWNSIAHKTGGGSGMLLTSDRAHQIAGPRYLEGWILAFSPWNDRGSFVLNSYDAAVGGSFGKMDTNDVPACTVEVPVTIDDNGAVHKTVFFAGVVASKLVNPTTVAPSVGWALLNPKVRE